VQGFGSAAQDAGVARLQAQACRVRGHVRARFVDDADDAERHAHAADLDAGRAAREAADFADGIFQRRDVFQPPGHLLDGAGGERQPVDERGVAPFLRGLRDVGAVRLDQFRAAGADFRGHRAQRAVLGVGVRARERPRGIPRGTAQLAHVGRDVN
jgi:hypothetical protein